MAPLDRLADEATSLLPEVEKAVLQAKKPADRVISLALRERRGLVGADQRFIAQSILSAFRWRGWLDRMDLDAPARLMMATLLDSSSGVPEVCKVWARRAGWDVSRLFALGDAPTWHGLVDGLRQILGEKPVSGDPWLNFPSWVHEQLASPRGDQHPKAFHLALLRALQARSPLWVRVVGDDPAKIWKQLTDLGVKPWIHRHLDAVGKLPADVEVTQLPQFAKGLLEIQDLGAQVVGLVCDPDPGERWWDACAGLGGKSLHLSALMKGQGVVVASDVHEPKLRELAKRARRTPFRNVTTRAWDGKRVVGKPGSYQGVLVDPPSSAIGTWRRHPDARWLVTAEDVAAFARQQYQILESAAAGVKVGGTLVYTVATATIAETTGLLSAFLAAHDEFRLDPFPDPIDGTATDGTLQIWTQLVDADATFIAKLIRNR